MSDRAIGLRALTLFCMVIPVVTGWTALAGDREEQWLYRQPRDAQSPPVAVFLSWEFSRVLFRARCENKNQLVIQYFGDDAYPLTDGKLAIGVDDLNYDFVSLKTTLISSGTLDGRKNVLEGRLTVTAKFAERIAAAEAIAIDAPNEMEEEWHTGSAGPLKRVVRDCH